MLGRDAASARSKGGSGRVSYLAPSGGRGSCLGLRTGVSPHFSTNSKREMLADHERGAASPPSSPMPDFWGCTLTRPRSHTDCARPMLSDAVARVRSPPAAHCCQPSARYSLGGPPQARRPLLAALSTRLSRSSAPTGSCRARLGGPYLLGSYSNWGWHHCRVVGDSRVIIDQERRKASRESAAETINNKPPHCYS